jgi:PAS domain S-box-containing protein
MTGVVLDVTEAREAEGELRALQERLEVAQWGGGFGVFDWNLKTGRVKWTSGMERLFGMAPGSFEETYDAWAARVPPEDVAAVRAALDAAVAEHRPEVGFFFRAADPAAGTFGGDRWVEAKCSILYDQSGEAQRIIGINLDVTHLKEAEEAARRGEARFRELADAMPQIVWAADASGRVYYGNHRWRDRIPDDDGSLFDRRDAWLQQVHPDDRALVTEAWAQAVRAGGPYQAEYRFLDRPTGTYRWYLDRAAPVHGPGGRPLRWFGTSTDIDDPKRAQERLGEIVNELNRSNRELEDFAHMASLDLTEPLRGIRN